MNTGKRGCLLMQFEKIDRETWPRREYFEHYFGAVPCTYSMTVKLDITPILESGRKLYPSLLYYLTTIVNRHAEFRTAINSGGELGVYSEMVPSYTIFHRDTETFSCLWTDYQPELGAFCDAYEEDLRQYGQVHGLAAKPGVPENSFDVSMIPGAAFEGFNLNLEKGYDYLKPIFTMGKYQWVNGRAVLPLAVQVHHAVCDGFHVCRFVQELQQAIGA